MQDYAETVYTKTVDVDFDPAKDAGNRDKHGISLKRTGELDIVAVVENSRPEDEERRFRLYGLIEGEPYCAIATFRNKAVRAISLRKASRRERKIYGFETED